MSVETAYSTINKLQPEAFSVEYNSLINQAALFKDVESYLGEYRFRLTMSGYMLRFGSDEEGAFRLMGEHENEPMVDKIRRGIEKKRQLWQDATREEADLAGVFQLEQQLRGAASGDIVLWAMPPKPGSKEYGNHGFIYVGRIDVSRTHQDEKKITMVGFRIEDKNLEKYNRVMKRFTGWQHQHSSSEDFVANPVVVKILADPDIFGVLEETFSFKKRENESEMFDLVMRLLHPYIDGFVDLVKKETSLSCRQRAFFALEKEAIKIWSQVKVNFDFTYLAPRSFQTIISEDDGVPPPHVFGSCGSSGPTDQSGNIFTQNSILKTLLFNEMVENFLCPVCHQESVPPVGNRCPKCGITKEEAANKGLKTC